MGVNGNNPKKGKKERKFQQAKPAGETADWMSVNSTLVLEVISALSRAGGAARFGYTRDGGAYAIGVYGDGDPYTVYVGPDEDCDAILRQMVEAFNE